MERLLQSVGELFAQDEDSLPHGPPHSAEHVRRRRGDQVGAIRGEQPGAPEANEVRTGGHDHAVCAGEELSQPRRGGVATGRGVDTEDDRSRAAPEVLLRRGISPRR